MFERFTRAAREAVIRAQEEAREQGSPTVGAEHVLLGVLADPVGPPARALQRLGVDAAQVAGEVRRAAGLDDEALSSLGIDLDEVRRRAEDAFGPGALDPAPRSRWGRPRTTGHLPLTPEAKESLEMALRRALAAGDREIGSVQVFSGLLSTAGGTSLRVLRRLGVTVPCEELIQIVRAEVDQAA